jgi:hypothetical protein
METMSETEKNSLPNSGEALGDSVPENEPNKVANVNLEHGTLHYSVVMTTEGNIRVKDCYWEAKNIVTFDGSICSILK